MKVLNIKYFIYITIFITWKYFRNWAFGIIDLVIYLAHQSFVIITLVIPRFWVQNDQYFPSFSYFLL